MKKGRVCGNSEAPATGNAATVAQALDDADGLKKIEYMLDYLITGATNVPMLKGSP